MGDDDIEDDEIDALIEELEWGEALANGEDYPLKHHMTTTDPRPSGKDKTIGVLLSMASVGLGVLYLTDGPFNWIEGAVILAAMATIALISSLGGSVNDWQKERQFIRPGSSALYHQEMAPSMTDGGRANQTVIVARLGRMLKLLLAETRQGDTVPVNSILIDVSRYPSKERQSNGDIRTISKVPVSDADFLSPESRGTADCFIPSEILVRGGDGLIKVAPSIVDSVPKKPPVGPNIVATVADHAGNLGQAAAHLGFLALLTDALVSLAKMALNVERASWQPLSLVATTPDVLPLTATIIVAFATYTKLKEKRIDLLRACSAVGVAAAIEDGFNGMSGREDGPESHLHVPTHTPDVRVDEVFCTGLVRRIAKSLILIRLSVSLPQSPKSFSCQRLPCVDISISIILASLDLVVDPPQKSRPSQDPDPGGSFANSETSWETVLNESVEQLAIVFLLYSGFAGILGAVEGGISGWPCMSAVGVTMLLFVSALTSVINRSASAQSAGSGTSRCLRRRSFLPGDPREMNNGQFIAGRRQGGTSGLWRRLLGDAWPRARPGDPKAPTRPHRGVGAHQRDGNLSWWFEIPNRPTAVGQITCELPVTIIKTGIYTVWPLSGSGCSAKAGRLISAWRRAKPQLCSAAHAEVT
ncbi:hypothetical protein B0T16DRAFT_387981 [Cercophora newfieldiana]|uniref:Uncharacterized protein n=1 Tax=Cercophora newfieldiana TaxID=92897 RepID=A0AA40CVC5_9PEZI|nr:hypothetical protein B0T16DRAFT_387981 [Cercophora newfieldiana]